MNAPAAMALLCALAAPLPARAEDRPPEPDAYRTSNYRAPTPATLKGARVLTSEQAHELWRKNAAAFIDVLPAVPRPAKLDPKAVWRDKPRLDIPGSVWLPDTGYGELAPITESYFETGLQKATRGDVTAPLVFYCLRDCWMSWNAARRAVALGYRDVGWYAEGTDGWASAGYPLEDRQPEARP
jgi:PQQ-dependent catabolism-associated CXXCW motif protein